MTGAQAIKATALRQVLIDERIHLAPFRGGRITGPTLCGIAQQGDDVRIARPDVIDCPTCFHLSGGKLSF